MLAMLIAVVSSRIGHDVARHRQLAIWLCHAAEDARRRGGTWLIADRSAIEPWAQVAAKRFGIPVQVLVAAAKKESSKNDSAAIARGDLCHRDRNLNRDAAVIDLADRVEGLYVRRGGKIQAAIEHRISRSRDGQIRVAIWPREKTAAEALIDSGAIGWFIGDFDSRRRDDAPANDWPIRGSVRITPPPGEWLVHCTRRAGGRWVDQTDDQYRAAMLDRTDDGSDRNAIDALSRILKQGRLFGSAISSSHRHKVVCFSARRIDELLLGRTFRSHLSRWDYEPYGLMIRRDAAQRAGLQGVIYGEPADRQALEPPDQYRFHPVGKTHDWTAEKEWRFRGDLLLKEFRNDEIRVFALDRPRCRETLKDCRYEVIWATDQSSTGMPGYGGGDQQNDPGHRVVRETDIEFIIAAASGSALVDN